MERGCPEDSKKVQAQFSGSSVSRAIRDWNWCIFLLILKWLEIVIFEISIIFHKIDRFWSRIARLTDLSLFRIVRASSFHRVLTQFCEWTRGSAIHDLTLADFATKFSRDTYFSRGVRGQTPKVWKPKMGLKVVWYIFRKSQEVWGP